MPDSPNECAPSAQNAPRAQNAHRAQNAQRDTARTVRDTAAWTVAVVARALEDARTLR